ncbi:MAG: hypothetical protein HRT81_11990 [Henriciella sp.]|nr:hypothetical protein [Henriciella sp.]
MIEAMVEWAGQTSTAWWVLSIAILIIFVEAFRASKQVFWADMIDEDE